jgi:NAD(P)-dependent dehydrogenase (short-subunit alcohol dehydrogenase family)
LKGPKITEKEDLISQRRVIMGDRLKGKVAIVAGAGSHPGEGIGNGKAAAVLYAREGASVMVADLSREAAEDTKRMIDGEGGRSFVLQGDVSDPRTCQAMAEQCLKTCGRIDILHNNVGIGQNPAGGPLEVDEALWDRLMNINLKSMFLTCRAVLPQMVKQGKGAILNISSVAAIRSSYPQFVYSVSKAGVNALTCSLAVEFAERGIRVNAIMPGLIYTPRIGAVKAQVYYGGDVERMKRERAARVPMKQMGEAWDVAYAALFLVSDEAKYITGQVLAVDGGMLCKG